jgi:hypothetical protein
MVLLLLMVASLVRVRGRLVAIRIESHDRSYHWSLRAPNASQCNPEATTIDGEQQDDRDNPGHGRSAREVDDHQSRGIDAVAASLYAAE